MEYNNDKHPVNELSEKTYMTSQTPTFLIQNGYRYLQLIGEGSNGKTYKARNLKTGEEIAVKALKFSENLKNYDLFRREADVLKSLNIKGVPRYYDFITQGNEFTECWLAQEFIQGRSLLDELESGHRFDEYETLLIMRDVARIVYDLQTMYAPSIIHRDIKPSNIMLNGQITDEHELHLIDFGAVANPQKRAGGSTVAGTVGYMAPEQLMGDCTIQSDYYAIGATALHLMTGIAPSDLPSQGFNLLFEEQLKTSVPDIHPKTLDLLRKLLAAKQQERPKDASELIRLINEALLDLYKSIQKSRSFQSLVLEDLLKLLDGFLTLIRLPLYGLLSFAIVFCLIWEITGMMTLINAGSSDFDWLMLFFILFVQFGSAAMISLVSFLRNYAQSKVARLNADQLHSTFYSSQRYLPSELEKEMKEKAALNQINAENCVQGTVVAVHPSGTEFAFVVENKTYVCFEPENTRRVINDKVQVLYQRRFGKMYGQLGRAIKK